MRSSDLAAPEFFVTTESWLNAKAGPSERGYVFSIYMVGTFVAIALGQLLISRVEIGTTTPFNIIVVLFAAALVLVSTTRADQPHAVAIPYLACGPCLGRRGGKMVLPNSRSTGGSQELTSGTSASRMICAIATR
jgi:hypothetical protein